MIVLLSLLLAQNPDFERVKCTSIGGPFRVGVDKPVAVHMKCCPRDFYVADPKHPTDNKGNLICTRKI